MEICFVTVDELFFWLQDNKIREQGETTKYIQREQALVYVQR